jgi:hypothetical protein
VIPLCAKLSAMLGLLILGLWITGRVLTDDYHWSQYIWWSPSIVVLLGAWFLLVLSFVFELMARRSKGLFLRPLLLIMNLGCTVYLFFGVWHIHRALFSSSPSSQALRVVHWNQSAKEVDQEKWAANVLGLDADFVFVTNPLWGESRQSLLDSLAPMAPAERERWVNYSYRSHVQPAHYRIEGNALIASKYAMIRTGRVSLVGEVDENISTRPGGSRGWVLFIEFDLARPFQELNSQPQTVQSIPEPFVVWFVDVPSEPALWRRELMSNARTAIDNWNGNGHVMGKHVWETSQTDTPFPEPDLIIGDFNTPRGSSSIDLLSPNMSDAFEQVGWGRSRSWSPKTNNFITRTLSKFANWHIDLALTNERWKATNYRTMDTSTWGKSEHQMQLVDLAPVIKSD